MDKYDGRIQSEVIARRAEEMDRISRDYLRKREPREEFMESLSLVWRPFLLGVFVVFSGVVLSAAFMIVAKWLKLNGLI